MAKPTKRAEVNSFIGGLITEASPLNYPPNASLDEENFELNRDGSRDRRLGMDYELSFVRSATTIPVASAATVRFSTFIWTSVSGTLDDDFLVVQGDQLLKFYRLSADSLSGTGYVGELSLTTFPTTTAYAFTAIDGRLVVAAGVDTIAIVSFNGTVFSVEYDRIKTRDVWGAQVTTTPKYETDITYRGPHDDIHHYNLQNQSWGIPRKDSAGVLRDPYLIYNGDLLKYPSNSEAVWVGLQFQPVTAGVTFERIYSNLFTETLGASVSAAKGYFIIDALRRGTSRMDEYTNNYNKYPELGYPVVFLPSDITSGGAKIVTEFAGRVWYGGFDGTVVGGDSRSPNYSNFVFFTQLIKSRADFTKCYQEGDPSSRDSADLVDTDGGFVRVSGAKNIIALINLDTSLVIIADNGVWHLTGGADFGFSATNYKIVKLSAFGGMSRSSVVVEGGRAFFWSEDGIYSISKDNLGSLGVTNVTQTTIQTLYEAIPNTSKETAFGVYDRVGKKVRWLYQVGTQFGTDSVTKELVLDTVISAFYQNRIGNLSPHTVQVLGLFPSTPFKRGVVTTPVYAGLDAVFSNLDAVENTEIIRTTGVQSVRYLAVEILNGIVYTTFSYYNNINFLDWKSVNNVGVDAKAYLLSGQQTAGDSAIAKQIPYLVMYFTRTEEGVTAELIPNRQSGCLMRCQWDFADTIISKKWSALVQTYRYRRAQLVTGLSDTYDNGFSVVSSKSKIRGRGKAFSLYLETEPTKDCRILGWSISLNGNSNV